MDGILSSFMDKMQEIVQSSSIGFGNARAEAHRDPGGVIILQKQEYPLLQLTIAPDHDHDVEMLRCEYLFTNADNRSYTWSRALWVPENSASFLATKDREFKNIGEACGYFLLPFSDRNLRPPQDAV